MQHSLAGCRARDIKRISELNSTQQPGLLTHGRLGGYFTREVEGTGAKSKHGYRPVDWDFLPVHPLVQHTTGWLDDFRLSWGTEKKTQTTLRSGHGTRSPSTLTSMDSNWHQHMAKRPRRYGRRRRGSSWTRDLAPILLPLVVDWQSLFSASSSDGAR